MSPYQIYDPDQMALDLDGWLPHSDPLNGIHGPFIGESIYGITNYLSVPAQQAYRGIKAHRELLGSDTYGLLTNAGPNAVYWLSEDPGELERYVRYRAGDIDTRVRVTKAMAERWEYLGQQSNDAMVTLMAGLFIDQTDAWLKAWSKLSKAAQKAQQQRAQQAAQAQATANAGGTKKSGG